MGEPRFEGDIWTKNLTLQELNAELVNSKYTHVYVFKSDDIFKNKYGSLFENTNIKNKTMYKINVHEGNVLLSEVK